MAAKTNSRLYDGRGQCVVLGSELGRGGEGSVFETSVNAGIVAKVYHKDVDIEKSAKLQCMVAIRTDPLARLAAWPISTIHETPGGPVRGFVMPNVGNFRPVHSLYSPKSRLTEFPEANWKFLIHTARNLAHVFGVIHQHGHVIGDVNHGNVVASPNGLVCLIDCDSFQITSGGQRYLCEVGVSTHTPPELQNRPFRGVVRTDNHDAFGLAVLIFQMLFMGRHPFSGAFLGVGDMSIERAIQENRFAYGVNAGSRQMKPPPATLSLQSVSSTVATLFERAFLQNDGRPKPQEWATALTGLISNTKQCTRNNGHFFLGELSICPWCEIEIRSSIILFNIVAVRGGHVHSAFNLAMVWANIAAIHPPGPPPALPSKIHLTPTPSEKAMQHRTQRTLRMYVGIGIMALSVVAVLGIGLEIGNAILAVSFAAIIALSLATNGSTEIKRETEGIKREAERRWKILEHRWQNEASDSVFYQKLRELETLKAQHFDLQTKRQGMLRKLEAERRQRQLHKYLDRFQITHAAISGIGPGRKATLESYGIETAADVEEYIVMAIPGFGPTYTTKLLAWRHSVEVRFVFNPNLAVDAADIATMDREIAVARAQMEQELLNGPAQLQRIKDQIIAQRGVLGTAIRHELTTLAQAETDIRALNPLNGL